MIKAAGNLPRIWVLSCMARGKADSSSARKKLEVTSRRVTKHIDIIGDGSHAHQPHIPSGAQRIPDVAKYSVA